MTGFHDRFTVDLYELRRAAREKLPSVGSAYVAAANRVHLTRWYDGALFPPGCPVRPGFERLRDRLQRVLAVTADNVFAAGGALDAVVGMYAAADADSLRELEAATAEKGMVPRPPETMPRARPPGEPIGVDEVPSRIGTTDVDVPGAGGPAATRYPDNRDVKPIGAGEIAALVERLREKAYDAYVLETAVALRGAYVPPEYYAPFEARLASAMERFRGFTEGRPEAAGDMIALLVAARAELDRPRGTDLAEFAPRLDGWTGNAAEEFLEGFLKPFHDISLNQRDFVDAVIAALSRYQRIRLLARGRADEIGRQAVKALEALPNGKGAGDFAVALVTSALALGGAVAAKPGTMVMRFLVAEKGVDLSYKLVSIENGSVKAVLDSMNDAVTALIASVEEQLRSLAADEQRTYDRYQLFDRPEVRERHRGGVIDDQREELWGTLLVPPRPQIVASVASGHFDEIRPPSYRVPPR